MLSPTSRSATLLVLISAVDFLFISRSRPSFASGAWPMRVGVSLAGPDFGMVNRHLSNLPYDDVFRLAKKLLQQSQTRLASFAQSLERNNAPGILGKGGVPTGDRRWIALITELSRKAEQYQIPLIGCVAGEWWKDYPLSIQFLLEPGNQPSWNAWDWQI